jgi:hypothetical protein
MVVVESSKEGDIMLWVAEEKGLEVVAQRGDLKLRLEKRFWESFECF